MKTRPQTQLDSEGKKRGRSIQPRYDPPANMSCEAAAVVARAFDFAAGLGDTHVRLKHLWAAIASEPSTGRSIWFGTHQRPDERVEARVRRRFLRQWKVTGLLQQERKLPAPERPRPQLPLAGVTRQVLRRAAQEARELAHPRIGTEHLVLALMRQVRARLFRDAAKYYCAYLEVRREVADFARTANRSRRVLTPVRAGDSPARIRAPSGR